MPVPVQAGRKQGTDRSADTRCNSLHDGIRRTKKERGNDYPNHKSKPLRQENWEVFYK